MPCRPAGMAVRVHATRHARRRPVSRRRDSARRPVSRMSRSFRGSPACLSQARHRPFLSRVAGLSRASHAGVLCQVGASPALSRAPPVRRSRLSPPFAAFRRLVPSFAAFRRLVPPPASRATQARVPVKAGPPGPSRAPATQR